MSAMNTLKKFGLEQAFNYVYKDPDKNFIKIMDWADKFSGGGFPTQRAMIRAAISNQEHPYYPFIHRLVTDIDPHVMKTLVANFFINANLAGWKKQDECREKYGCNIPWAILLDPTSACNLHCTGCWAAEYGNKLNLTYDEIDDIIRQGKELGVYMYIYTGGEPLVRKKDLIRLCEKHNDCIFLSFTNATLIDEDFANDMLRVGNFVPAISLEGFETATDGRRGNGVYQKVIKAINLLREKKLVFGISACYTSANFESITSEAFYDSLIDLGAYFICRLEMMQHRSCFLLLHREEKPMSVSVNTVQQSRCLPWISRMMQSLWEDVLQAAVAICISMQTAISIHVCLSIILIPISARKHFWKHCSLR